MALLGKPKTVDSVIAVFANAITDLTAISEESEKEIVELTERLDVLCFEKHRAKSILTNLEELINV